MDHVIREQHLHVEFDGPEAEAAGLQRRLQRFCQDYLLPVIEVTLNKQVPEDEHLFLEKLVIDAGTIPLERLEEELAQSVQKELQQTLREELAVPRVNSRRRNTLQALTEVFLHFLEHGSLPWWFQLPAGKELEQALLECWLSGDHHDAVVIALEEALIPLRKEQARTRLMLQFSEKFRAVLLPLLAPQVGVRVGAVLEQLTDIALPEASLATIRDQVWRHGFSAAAHHANVTEHELVSRAFLELPLSIRESPEVNAALTRHWPGTTPTGARGAQVTTQKRDAPARDEDAADHQNKASRDGIYVDNGGIVLLHPYLRQLFERLEISRENRIIEPERGIAVLNYLASGALDQPEYRLALAKVLCDLPLHASIPRDIELADQGKETCDSLLQALLKHWGALRNSSVDGLRGSFLMRPAKLTLRGNDEWLLQVEKNSYDILLDQLPFSISMVKLPWMPKLLWVEWN
ncbi:contractile injection system tape measure protein [Geomonas azotofigens]|uniref:contractile injection system tape measure protein n=1 Tax=Geomonas azotofigens TaxID=2843196 RepID=UPI001C1140B4|nr:contractile injection system tape measure protein [Geomonas azotofigens]MBU5612520.1 hypothetical protein [Geomonas azotofigens]